MFAATTAPSLDFLGVWMGLMHADGATTQNRAVQ